MQNDVVEILRCPENHATLARADAALIAELNNLIRAKRLHNRAGRQVTEPIDSGFIRTDGDLLYPIVDQIPILLREEAIPLDPLDK